MKFSRIHTFLLFFSFSFMACAKDYEYIIYTAPNPPYIEDADEKGNLEKGLFIESLITVLNNNKIKYKINNLPWKRAQDYAQEKEDSLVFALTRTPERESKYKWVSKLLDEDINAYVLSDSDIKVGSLADIYKIGSVGVLAGGGALSVLKNSKEYVEASLNMVKEEEANIQMLNLKRNKIWVTQDKKATYLSKKKDVKIKSVYKVGRINMWFATSTKTSDKSVEFIRDHLENFKKSKEYNEILKKYL